MRRFAFIMMIMAALLFAGPFGDDGAGIFGSAAGPDGGSNVMAVAPGIAEASYEDGLRSRNAGDFGGALEHWMAASDDPRSMAAIAGLYDRGDGVAQNAETAAEWYRRAAAGGNFRAVAQLANYSVLGIGGDTRPPAEWRAELEKIRGRDPYADYMLAFFYANGHGGERKLDDALELLEPLSESGYAPFTALYEEVSLRIDDRDEGVTEAEFLTGEMMALGEEAFGASWRDRRIAVSGWVNGVRVLKDHGCVVRLCGPNLSSVPTDNIIAVFYAPLAADPVLQLKRGDYIKMDGVYVGRHPFALGPGAFTLFGCSLLRPAGQQSVPAAEAADAEGSPQ